MKRRQEAVETGLAALQKMSASQDPALAARICADWMGGSLNRLLADMTDARDHGVRLVELGQKTVQTVLTAQAETTATEVAKATAATETTTLRAAA
jgi:urease accessory protein UreF